MRSRSAVFEITWEQTRFNIVDINIVVFEYLEYIPPSTVSQTINFRLHLLFSLCVIIPVFILLHHRSTLSCQKIVCGGHFKCETAICIKNFVTLWQKQILLLSNPICQGQGFFKHLLLFLHEHQWKIPFRNTWIDRDSNEE